MDHKKTSNIRPTGYLNQDIPSIPSFDVWCSKYKGSAGDLYLDEGGTYTDTIQYQTQARILKFGN